MFIVEEYVELLYETKKLAEQCNSIKEAKKLFSGDVLLVQSFLSRINALKNALVIKDIIMMKSFRFHKLKNIGRKNLEGYFAIDVKSIKEPWRIIIQPLDENKNPYNSCNIDQISGIVKIVKIMEVSKHYE